MLGFLTGPNENKNMPSEEAGLDDSTAFSRNLIGKYNLNEVSKYKIVQ
jgi:hypothetical protein